jgi:4-hydroxy-tetrahydrodipicolinate reductase
MTGTGPLRIGIAGALGRMGRVVAALIRARTDMSLAAGFDRPDAAGQEVDGLRLSPVRDALGGCDVIIDFSTGQASAELAKLAAGRGGPALVIGSTGFSETDEAAVLEASRRVAIVKSGNYSLGVNLLLGLVEQAARALSAGDYDIEVFEAHHRRKIDAPSGTALMLGEAAARGRQLDLATASERGRDGLTGARTPGAIGFSVMRGGGIVGEHSVIFAADDEIITLAHSARDRSLFARGAIEAARWVAGRPAGLYTMTDVLGLATREG